MTQVKNLFVLFVCMFLCNTPVQAHIPVEKFYVPRDTAIEITDQTIVLHFSDQLVEINELYQDEEGVYIIEVVRITETCSKCKEFAMVNGKCLNCGYDKNKKENERKQRR